MRRFLFGLFLLVSWLIASDGATVTVSNANDLVKLFEDLSAPVEDDIDVVDDLDFSHTTLTAPLGSTNHACYAFYGTLHGGGHAVKNLAMGNASSSYSALFCNLVNATI